MYYYIIDIPKNKSDRNQQERIKNILSLLGISGEIAKVSPARTVAELAAMGVEKGYSTIVAIGGDELVNQVASIIANTDSVLGIIPVNASTSVTNLIGTNDVKKACEILQKRNLHPIDMACIEPSKRFLTQAMIESPRILQVQAEIDKYYLETQANKIIIDYNLGVHFINETQSGSWLKNLFGFSSSSKDSQSHSFFPAHKLRLRTHEIVPLKIGQITIAKTPIVAHQEPGVLKIISI